MVGKINKDLIFELYKNPRTVFRILDIAMLLGNEKENKLRKRLHYYVNTKRLLNPRKGFYSKPGYNPEELACLLYTPNYISLEYVLQKAGVIFQYDKAITNVSYLSREIIIDNLTFRYRQIKGEILTNTTGLILNDNNVNMATPERAFLDMLYLNKDFYFDNIHILNKNKIEKLLPIYGSQSLNKTVAKIIKL